MMGIPFCQDLRVRGQDFLHLVIRQCGQKRKASGPNPERVTVSGMERMDPDRIGAFLPMHANRVDIARDRQEGGVARFLTQPHEGAQRHRVDAEACACKSAQDVDLRAEVVASCVRILVEKACPHQREKHPADGRLGKITLRDEFREAGAGGSRPAHEKKQGGSPVDALCT